MFTAILDACAIAGIEREMLVRQLVLIRRSAGMVPDWALPWLEREAAADFLLLFAPVLVPGLFQAEEYATEVFLAAGMDEDQAAAYVAARMAREAILDTFCCLRRNNLKRGSEGAVIPDMSTAVRTMSSVWDVVRVLRS